ncbi:MAG TPA: serine/threonine-protein kinase, partial [Pyrinomonadaceae bacterium]|nr:serine/threonine-protein kinase [Pyrinomonadaceae bacterium]
MKLCPACQHCYEDTDAVCSFDSSVLVPYRHGSRMIAGKYRLDRLLGRGGMGAVYEGTHVDLERPVAVKLLLPDFTADPEALERFRREARAAARLNHPNVADTYDYGSLPEGGAYIVMELIAGETLRERMDAVGQLPFGEAIQIARQVTSGVEAAHRSGITHRDLKPSNIILTRDHDGRMLAKVVDFSVAKLKEGTTSGAALTATGSLIGTPRYMAPEQCADNKTDARSDIYSLGVILYEMLAGRAPFEGPTTTAIAIKHIQEPPTPVEKFRTDTPASLRELIAQSLAKSPSERPQTAQEFAARLDEAAKELPVAEADGQALTSKDKTNSATEKRAAETNPQKIE